jgi:hypothetical protein
LDAAGLLDDNPLTPAQMEFLRSNGLGVPQGDQPTLGDLNDAQRDALLRAGLLDNVPLSAAERAQLGFDDRQGQPQSGLLPGRQVLTNPFPTTVDGVDVSPGLGSQTQLPLGDVSRPGSATYSQSPGLVVGTGGLSGVPGLSGSPGTLNSSNLGQTFNTGGGAGASGSPGATGATGAAGAGGAGGPGMPFMPPFMPPMGGAPVGQDRDRSRNTWLQEDEEVWGTDPDCAPAVIGKRGKPSQTERSDDRPDPGFDRPDEDERRRHRGR